VADSSSNINTFSARPRVSTQQRQAESVLGVIDQEYTQVLSIANHPQNGGRLLVDFMENRMFAHLDRL
jgi:hypothetical protein